MCESVRAAYGHIQALRSYERIIFQFNSIPSLEEIGEKLELKGLVSRMYCVDMPAESKFNPFQDWSTGIVKIMLSSSAFLVLGMFLSRKAVFI